MNAPPDARPNPAIREFRSGHRTPPRREHIQALRNASDNLFRMVSQLRDDENAKPALLEIARHLEGMRSTALHAAHMPGARMPDGSMPSGPEAA